MTSPPHDGAEPDAHDSRLAGTAPCPGDHMAHHRTQHLAVVEHYLAQLRRQAGRQTRPNGLRQALDVTAPERQGAEPRRAGSGAGPGSPLVSSKSGRPTARP
jgi:hypothetical protein